MSSNIKKCEIEGINNVDNPLTPELDLTVREFIMDIRSLDGKQVVVTITRDWKTPWNFGSRRNIKREGVIVSHLLAWPCKLHGYVILPSFQKMIKR